MFRAVCRALLAALTWKSGCEGHAGGNFTLPDDVEGSAENVPRSVLTEGCVGAIIGRRDSLGIMRMEWFVLLGQILVSDCLSLYTD